MSYEPDLFSAVELRDAGIEQSVLHANAVHDKWSVTAYKFCLEYIKTHQTLMAEDIRTAASGIVPDPPSARAWSGPVMQLIREGKITRIGFANTKSPGSHATPASKYKSNLYRG
jgi:hypothetical protein